MFEKIIKMQNQVAEIENWFKNYDIKAIQYARDIRTYNTSSIDIISLDKEAYAKAEELKKLRNEIIATYKSFE